MSARQIGLQYRDWIQFDWFSGVYEDDNYRPTWSDRASYLVFVAASVQVLVWSIIVLIKHHSASLLTCVTLSSCLLFTNELKCSIYETLILRIKCYWLWMHTVLLCLPVHLYMWVSVACVCLCLISAGLALYTHTHAHTEGARCVCQDSPVFCGCFLFALCICFKLLLECISFYCVKCTQCTSNWIFWCVNGKLCFSGE